MMLKHETRVRSLYLVKGFHHTHHTLTGFFYAFPAMQTQTGRSA